MTATTALKDRITEDMKAAMRAKDAARLSAIRLLQAAIKQKEVDERIVADDAAVLAIVEKLIKQRKDSIEQFDKAGRTDLVGQGKGGTRSAVGLPAAADVGRRTGGAIDAAIAEIRRGRSAGHGQGDGAAQAAHCRPCRHGQGLGVGQAAAS